jgi:holin-like protein
MVNGLIVLIAFLFAGDITSKALELPVPGGIIGMLFMLIALMIRGKVDEPIDFTSRNLIAYIGLLFVPAGVGISQYFDLLAQEWPIILFAGVSTMFLTLGISALLFRTLSQAEK